MVKLSAESVANSLHQLPALHPVVVKLLESFEKAGVDTQSLVHEIAQDQALVTRVLRLANSSFYGLPSHVDSLKDAVMILGFRTVRAVAVAVSLTDCFSSRKVPGFDTNAFWQHSAAVGMAAREIAAIVKRPTDVAFTAGIVHDIGVIALLWLHPKDMAAVLAACRDNGLPLDVAEREVFGVDHCAIGAALARHWNLPEALVESIASHEQPANAEAGSLADIVHVANAIIHDYGLPAIEVITVSAVSDLAMNRLGIGNAELRRVVARLDADLKHTFQILFG